MLDGFYTVKFETELGAGGGVVILQGGSLKGGDSMMYYIGRYQAAQDNFSATLDFVTHLHVPGITSVFGVENASLAAHGKVLPNGSIEGQATSPSAPGAVLRFTMQKLD
ncbi:GrlR family regulatory protein [Paracoccus sp. 22332]|uniref:GrlR family regulatory protein n=1 Tax=Paracoccus sp. 22332 TaxID=3453913 RepID=UPI003F85A55A